MSSPESETHAHEEHAHPGPRQYVFIAVVLTVITAIEVLIYYIPAVEDYLVPFLIAFSFLKFVLVAGWFMHLKFDSRVFKRFFVTGIILAFLVFAIVLTTFLARGGPAPVVTG